MKNFELYNPVRILFGNGEVEKIGVCAAQYGKKALLVSYGDHAFLRELIHRVEANLAAQGVTVVEFFKVQANPLLSHIREAIALCRREQVEICIALGGGSVMDSTKAIAAGVCYPDDPWKMFVSRHDREVAVPPTETLPTVMIPTLPATSSEMNCIAVATNDETAEKAYIWSPAIFPKVSILDPSLTCSLPPKQTAIGAIDAMSHVLEAYLNGDQYSPLQDRLHEGILVTIMAELRAVLQDPQAVSHRANLQWASTLAWNGYIQSGLDAPTPMHQMGHVLSALYNTTHGVTLAIFMNAYFRYTCTLNAERAARFALLGEHIFGLDRQGRADKDVAQETVRRMVSFMDEVGVPFTLDEAGIPAEDHLRITEEILLHGCNAEGYLPSLPPIGREGIGEILRMAQSRETEA
ncbi:MAG: iron-containing alcohol dehydrogenase [Clostridia bacterium]|nr:iron-containing alcohol dehydrogenase [Clostridia bacterium]